ncbi:carboxymuconolactone decarboxylase family protein, partial [Escherichia coli]|nr:carboxymuconolactone decarboxylase family protein [Escherichia coli]
YELTAAYAETTLAPAEREIVLLTTSVHNECGYCVAGHSFYSKSTDLAEDVLAAIRDRRPIADPKKEALRLFSQALAERRGKNCEAEMRRFLEAGYSRDQILEVINGVALKTMANMTANLFELPLDEAFAPYSWSPPTARAA